MRCWGGLLAESTQVVERWSASTCSSLILGRLQMSALGGRVPDSRSPAACPRCAVTVSWGFAPPRTLEPWANPAYSASQCFTTCTNCPNWNVF